MTRKLVIRKGIGNLWYMYVRAGHTLTPLVCRSTHDEVLDILNSPESLRELNRSAEIAAFVAGHLRTGAI